MAPFKSVNYFRPEFSHKYVAKLTVQKKIGKYDGNLQSWDNLVETICGSYMPVILIIIAIINLEWKYLVFLVEVLLEMCAEKSAEIFALRC